MLEQLKRKKGKTERTQRFVCWAGVEMNRRRSCVKPTLDPEYAAWLRPAAGLSVMRT